MWYLYFLVSEIVLMLIGQLLLYPPTDMKTNWIRPSITFSLRVTSVCSSPTNSACNPCGTNCEYWFSINEVKGLTHTTMLPVVPENTCKQKFPLLQTTIIAYLYL